MSLVAPISGAELLKADFDDSESLTKALEGAYGAFVVTNYFDSNVQDKEKEVKQVRLLSIALYWTI